MTGREAYEDDVRRCPTYVDGTARDTWEQLSDLARTSWNRDPTPREYRTSAASDLACTTETRDAASAHKTNSHG